MKKGDILVSSWGYEQTNINFYEVVKATAKTVLLVALRSERHKNDFLQYYAMPILGSGFGTPFRRKIIEYGSEPFCSISSFEGARLWKGKPEEGTSYA